VCARGSAVGTKVVAAAAPGRRKSDSFLNLNQTASYTSIHSLGHGGSSLQVDIRRSVLSGSATFHLIHQTSRCCF
jgi:hypothetical protein